MNSPVFDYLGKHPMHIPLIAKWHNDEWHHISPHLTTELRIREYSSYSNAPSIPSCVIALIENQPAGSASLVESDMDSHPQLGPWLASVYVQPRFRQQGLATQLIQHCLDNARVSGIPTLYLFTPDKKDFYLKRGWKPVENTLYHGEIVDIMSYNLTRID